MQLGIGLPRVHRRWKFMHFSYKIFCVLKFNANKCEFIEMYMKESESTCSHFVHSSTQNIRWIDTERAVHWNVCLFASDMNVSCIMEIIFVYVHVNKRNMQKNTGMIFCFVLASNTHPIYVYTLHFIYSIIFSTSS